jgi:flagellar basal-body rod protein FlgB
MSITPLSHGDLFGLMNMRMDYLKQRQAMVAQNVANADLPGYKAKDLVSFSQALESRSEAGGRSGVRGAHVQPVSLALTDTAHINGSGNPTGASFGSNRPAASYETLPSGNSVVLEEQMMKISEIGNDYNLITNLYRNASGMMKLALGKGATA